jgi:hypothetical protein
MVDRYTKAILTVIAATLIVVVAQNAIRPTVAQQGPLKVQICEALNNCAELSGMMLTKDELEAEARLPPGVPPIPLRYGLAVVPGR